MSKLSKLLFVFIVSLFIISCSKNETADLILFNGNIITVDSAFSIQQAVVVKDQMILFTGTNKEVATYVGSDTKAIDLKGKTVLPGLIDAHAHLHSLGKELTELSISGTKSLDEIVEKVGKKVQNTPEGEWIVGGRWDQNDWPDKNLPYHDLLSKVSPNNPVYLTRVDGNSAFVNQKALEVAGITNNTPNPAGGVILRKPNGEATGVLINQAMNLVKTKIPAKSKDQLTNEFLMAVESCLAVGLTGIHEAGVRPDEIGIYKELIDNNQMDIRLYAMLGEQEKPKFQVDDLESFFRENKIDNYNGSNLLSVKSIKLFFDGALGSRGAAFFKPYTDDPDNTGILRVPPEYITEVSIAALKNGMGVNTHCIGVRGNRLCLDAYEAALKQFPETDHRFRIEHAQIVRDEDIAKFADLNVIPAMQPTHCTSDMFFVADRVGDDRAKGAYAWRSFINKGLVIPCGSDFPVESNNPFLGIYAAITRQNIDGEPEKGWYPEQALSIEEAIKGFTIWAAYGAFQEDILGSIESGKLADFTIIDKNILEIHPREIPNIKVMYTIVGGEIKYQRE